MLFDVILIFGVAWLARGFFFTLFQRRRPRHTWGEFRSCEIMTILRDERRG